VVLVEIFETRGWTVIETYTTVLFKVRVTQREDATALYIAQAFDHFEMVQSSWRHGFWFGLPRLEYPNLGSFA